MPVWLGAAAAGQAAAQSSSFPLPPTWPHAGLLPLAFAGAAARLSPAATLAQQAAVVGLAAAAVDAQPCCRLPLLIDPLSVQRMSALHRYLDAVDPLSPLDWAQRAHSDGEARSSYVALAAFHGLVVGVLLPVVLACHAAPLPPDTGHPASRRRSGAVRFGDAGGGALAAALRHVRMTTPAALLIGWLLLSNSWLACKAMEAALCCTR